jgi:hypothetical protein
MTPLKVEVETIPPLPNSLSQEPIMAVPVEDLMQAVAEGVLRAVEARGGSHPGGQAAPTAATQSAVTSRPDLISQLFFEIRFRAGGMPPGPPGTFQAQTAE